MQTAAQGWLVYDITRSRFFLGVVSALSTLPMSLLSPFGGVVADRFPRRRIVLFTQVSLLFPPLALSLLVLVGKVEVWQIAALGALSGVINAFDMPARQAFVIELVGRQDLMNAIGLNSGIFNGARIVGPAIAGTLIVTVGIGYCFLLNSLSYIAVIVALIFIQTPMVVSQSESGSVLDTVTSGFKYISRNRRLFGLLGLLALVCVFGFSYTVLLPAFARDILDVSAQGYGYLLTFNGIGAVTGALFVATMASKVKNRKHILFIGISLFSVSIMLVSLMTRFTLALLPLVFAGMGMIMFLSTANTLIQTTVSDEFRGRVMGIWTFVFGGSMPLGSFVAGAMAQYLGVPLTIKIGALICATAALIASIFSETGSRTSSVSSV